MQVKLGKSFKGLHARAGLIVDLPEALAKKGLESGVYEPVKAAPRKVSSKPKPKTRKKTK